MQQSLLELLGAHREDAVIHGLERAGLDEIERSFVVARCDELVDVTTQLVDGATR
ncbi:MAG: hypothetical protein RMA76_44845 [Deltaproteobacteria bacterium]